MGKKLERVVTADPLRTLLAKEPELYTRRDLLRAVRELGIENFTFHYVGLEGRISSLRLPLNGLQLAERLLALGERVDGSSLFKGLVDASVSDLYVVPRYSSAFINPFDPKSLDFVCRFVNAEGELATFAPDGILLKSKEQLERESGCELWAMGELEFYLIYSTSLLSELYPVRSQGGYHISEPFLKHRQVLEEIADTVQRVTGALKYAHAEVGHINKLASKNRALHGQEAEQFELEFYPRPIDRAADDLCLARWLVRTIAARHGFLATFTPKLTEEAAGSGLHIHLELRREGRNIMLDEAGQLSSPARQLIGGLLRYVPTLTAFGNTQAASYLRLVPDHEAPTKICWSFSNRSSLVRVPLGWSKGGDLSRVVNPHEEGRYLPAESRQTVELRSPDGSAQIYLLLAGVMTAVKWALNHPQEALEVAQKTEVQGNIFHDPQLAATLTDLPRSCWEGAQYLERDRAFYEEDGLFPPFVIDYVLKALRREDDAHLQERLSTLVGEKRRQEYLEVLQRDLHRS